MRLVIILNLKHDQKIVSENDINNICFKWLMFNALITLGQI